MGFEKGHKKYGGRAKGSGNKDTKDLRAMILEALKRLGDDKWIEEQAKADPKTFISLLAKVLPMQVTGEGGGPIEGKWTIEVVKPE